MTKLWAALCIYREHELIRHAIDSVADFVDEVMILDSPFLGAQELPDDGTRQIALEAYPRARYIELPPMRETEKRSQFFQRIPEGDRMLVIDGDETLEETPNFTAYANGGKEFIEEMDDAPVLWLPMKAWNPRTRTFDDLGPRPRLIKVSRSYRYDNHHRNIVDGAGSLLTDSTFLAGRSVVVPGLQLVNWWNCRQDPARRKAWTDYGLMMSGLSWDERKLTDENEEGPRVRRLG